MKLRRVAAFGAMVSLVSVLSVACSLLVDTTGIAGDANGEHDGASGDVAIDRASGEAGDARLDAGGASDAASCEATFCDDFDTTPVGSTWTTTRVDNGGILGLGAPALSAPNALRTTFAAGTSTTTRTALLEKTLGVGTHLRCGVSIYAEARPQGHFVDVIQIATTGPNIGAYHLNFGISTPGGGETFRDDYFVDDGGCGCPLHESRPTAFPVGKWVRVGIETDFQTAILTYDGTVVTSGTYGGFVPSTAVSIAVGSIGYDNASGSVILADDVECTLAP